MAQIVKMPDGAQVSFPDDMPKEEIRALIEEKFPDAAKSRVKAPAEAPKPGDPKMPAELRQQIDAINAKTREPFRDSFSSEALSGINEGIGNALSLPATLGNAVLSVGPAIVNTLAGTDFKGADYLPDPGKPAMELMKMSGAIKPPRADLGSKVVRRVGQEVGAALPFGLTRPVATIAAAIGSGLGAATAQQVDPDNPWLELAGQFGGGAITSVLGTAATRLATKAPRPKGKAPTADELQLLKNEAYKVADGLGAKYSPKAYDKLVSNIEAATKFNTQGSGISPTRHPKAWSLIEDMRKRASKQYGQGLTLTELDQLRQEVRRDLLQSSDLSERHYGDLIIDEIDDAIAKAGAGDMLAGDSKAAAEAITAARELNTRWRKTELIEDALYAADLKTAASGSGGNINNAIRQAFKTILLNGKKRRAFSADDIKDMERVVKQGKGEELLRLVGKLSPGGNGLMTMLGIGGTAVNPLMAAVPIAGMAAKAVADRGTVGRANKLRAKVAQGANTLRAPASASSPPAVDAVPLGAAMTGATANAVANDNEKRNNALLRMNALN